MKKRRQLGAGLFLLLALALFSTPSRLVSQIKDEVDKVFGTGRHDVDNAVETGRNLIKMTKPMDFEEEHRLGRQVAARLAGNFGIWNDPNWTLYLNLVGRGLVPYSERADIKYRFAILKVDDINAYSTPAGYIFITRGMLKELGSEAELAGVLAHEIAHVAKKHIVKEVQKSNLYKTGASQAIRAATVDVESQQLIEKVNDQIFDLLINKGFSKQDEYDSDQTGTLNAWKMGYNPLGLRNFIATLQSQEKDQSPRMKRLLSTHPAPENRLKELDKFMAQNGLKPENRQDNKERFQAFKAKHPIP
ncbi:MAG: hypothetical protein A2V67_08735 [Deltaproteobacteria bacterium RBG_13_61_14]|nr:MAG: hypothetical protein A2V67_08735 [Deltaproteobacteria bacterium RBG_13_61_14]